MVPTIDGRMLETDNKWFEYCQEQGITNPFREEMDNFAKRCSVIERNGKQCTVIRSETPEEIAWRAEWAKRRDEYLRLEHTFRLWDFHFQMPWEKFSKHLEWSKNYADISIYMPCDAADRQCNMACAYFLSECPRKTGELKSPVKGVEGEYKYDIEYEI